jgi:hypothetical protein
LRVEFVGRLREAGPQHDENLVVVELALPCLDSFQPHLCCRDQAHVACALRLLEAADKRLGVVRAIGFETVGRIEQVQRGNRFQVRRLIANGGVDAQHHHRRLSPVRIEA